MIDLDNYNSMKQSHDKLLKQNTLLHARCNELTSATKQVVTASNKALKDMASMYDTANENVISHLIKQKLIVENSELHYNLLNIMPIKLG